VRSLQVFLNDDRIGTIAEEGSVWRFDYDEAWATSPQSFDLSPRLSRLSRSHVDGASDRPVQWYFDNLLPEERLREAVSKEAAVAGDDAFALLEYLGAESAGSLVLLPPGKAGEDAAGVRRLTDEALSARIRNLPRATLSAAAPKRMSAAGAQSKLLVVVRDGQLFEPVGAEPSTHLLKPDNPNGDYPASVINEFIVMKLAARLGLAVPPVMRHYTPEPVYLVERFDRATGSDGRTRRRHIVDACQLLDKARQFKYQAATLETLRDVIAACRNRAATRLRLFSWLAFNLLVANSDNHLKNLSFLVGHEGIELAPAYDLLSTALYDTTAFADDRAVWPNSPLAIALPNAATFADVSREAILAAGEVLGLARRIGARQIDRMIAAAPAALATLVTSIEEENSRQPEAVRPYVAGELRLLRVLQHLVVPEMLGRMADGAPPPGRRQAATQSR
jgi:serine/threonine-protein kinase HipA